MVQEMYQLPEKYAADPAQRTVIGLEKGYHLVLAPPGCGKTDILAERIARALADGFSPAEMLCLTFTNRASRGMQERVGRRLDGKVEDLFIGNIHRFCSRFLYQNGVIAQASSLLDDNDTLSIIEELLGKEEVLDGLPFDEKDGYLRIARIQHICEQFRCGHERALILGAEAFPGKEVASLCKFYGKDYSRTAVLELYEQMETWLAADRPNEHLAAVAQLLLNARRYRDYKRANGLHDFDDLLLMTYDHAKSHPDEIPHYRWIQIDEVQDLSPLQLAIVDEFTEKNDPCVVYLGDEQQAIFSFIGAKLETLEGLRTRCSGRIHHLYNNYRSPQYLLDVTNTFASRELDVDPALLPASDRNEMPGPDDLTIRHAPDKDDEYTLAASLAARYSESGRTAVLVPSNNDAEEISGRLDKAGIRHFKISGSDIFSSPRIQLLLSHLNVCLNPAGFLAWSRIFSHLGVFKTQAAARSFLRELERARLSPVDLLQHPGGSALSAFVRDWEEKDLVIFDTETTGLDVVHDDIVQIAAIKVRKGSIVSRFNCFLRTERPIPALLGDQSNPLPAAYAAARPLPRPEGLHAFLDFAQGCSLLGHNVRFDRAILDTNLRRDAGIRDLDARFPIFYDTLTFARLTDPDADSYRLKDLLERWGLEGENSHLADDDILATLSVARHCRETAEPVIQGQTACLETCPLTAAAFRSAYLDAWRHTRETLLEPAPEDGWPALAHELKWLYLHFLERKAISREPKLRYILQFLRQEVVDIPSEPLLLEQLQNHIMDLNTYKEADLCDSRTIGENLFISTVHKAKGLEFDNVLVFDVTEGTYPFFMSQTPAAVKEDARKFYVALSRARRRLCLLYCEKVKGISRRGFPYEMEREPSPFLRSIRHFFTEKP